MITLPSADPRAVQLVTAIQQGDVTSLEQQLHDNPELATARIVDEHGVGRTLLHVAADWPGHFPNGAAVVAALVRAGADVNAGLVHTRSQGPPETALHSAASSNDVPVLDALLDAGADIEAPGAIFTGGPAMSDAVIFAQWHAARRLLERGATTTLSQAAALGLLERVQELTASTHADVAELTNALWHGCRGGQREVVQYLVSSGADMNWIGYDHRTPLDVALESGNGELVQWLATTGAKHAAQLSS